VDVAPDLGSLMGELVPRIAELRRSTPQPEAVPDDMRFYPAPRPATAALLARIPARADTKPPPSVTMLVAVSGAGKTSSIFGAAAVVFTVYITCASWVVKDRLSLTVEEDYSTAFSKFRDVTSLRTRGVPRRGERAADEPERARALNENTLEGMRLSTAFVLAHLVTLLAFLRAFPDATPYQFIRFQCSADGQERIDAAFGKLEKLTGQALETLTRAVHVQLQAALDVRGHAKPLLVAVDEMEGAADDPVFRGQFLSRTGKEGRGLLSPMLRVLRDLAEKLKYATVVSGTGSVMSRSESITSDVGKGKGVARIQDKSFPLATLDQVADVLSKATGVAADEVKRIPDVIQYLANGRFRLTARTVREFEKGLESIDDARMRLAHAVNLSVEAHKQSLYDRFEALAVDEEDDATRRESVELLRRVYVASKFTGGRMPFQSAVDLCRMGIALVDEAGYFYVREAFVQDAIQTFFEEKLKDAEAKSAFETSVRALKLVVQERGASATDKGDMFENVLFHGLRLFDGRLVLEMPFVELRPRVLSRLREKSLWKGVKFECSGASGLEGSPNAASFLAAHPKTLLSPETTHRADGVLQFGPDCIFEFGAKFYSDAVPSDKTRAQYRATDPACAYELESAWEDPTNANRFNPKATAPRAAWTAAGHDLRVALRVHVCVPRAAVPANVAEREFKPGTFVLPDDSIVVNLDHTNLHLLLGKPRAAGAAAPSAPARSRRATAAAAATAAEPAGDEKPTDDEVLRALYRVLYEVTRQESFRL